MIQEKLEQAELLTRQVFGLQALRPHQKEICAHLFSGRDVLAVLPTGSGKSLCYALPAVMSPGTTLVISPLIALIREQVIKLNNLGIIAAAFDSLQSTDEKQEIWQRLNRREIKVLFVSPERLALPSFRDRLIQSPTKITQVAIDEAHCVSQWGDHFRPGYRRIGECLRDFGPVQKIALTATATRRVRDDVVMSLHLNNPEVIVAPITRDNLDLKVLKFGSSALQLSAILNSVLSTTGCGIVYSSTRKRVEELTTMLQDAGLPAIGYHAGLPGPQRQEAQRAFMCGDARVIVATNAFGLGIDKQDIRFVYHIGMPSSLEQYVQEIGRAGRDGNPAQCRLFYGGRDYHIQRFLIDKSFPEKKALQNAYAEIHQQLQKYAAIEEHRLIANLSQKPDFAGKDLVSILRVLTREGLLRIDNHLVQQGTVAEGAFVRVGTAGSDAENFFREYTQRKNEQLWKLEKMKEFLGSEGDGRNFLESYFD